MRFRKKKLLLLLAFALLIFAFFAIPSSPLAANFEAFAQDLEVEYPTVPGAPLSAEPTLPEYIKYLYNFSIIIAGLVAFFSLVYGGFRYLASVGSPAAMADARDQITAGMVGLIILLGSYIFLVAVNPQLVIFRLNPQELPSLEMPEPIPIELTAQAYDVYEIPIGTLISNLIETDAAVERLNTIVSIADRISDISEDIKNNAEELERLIDQCSCSNADPVCPGCGAAQCIGEVCPSRGEIERIKNEVLPSLTEELAAEIESMLPYITSLRKDLQRLKLGAEILKETIYPINYDNYLEIRQLIQEAGGDVRIIPFLFLGQRTPGLGDAATFYTDEERIAELLGNGRFPAFPRFDTNATCNECVIDLSADFDIPQSIKEELAATYPGITADCPDGLDCWDYVVRWAEINDWNPAFMLAMWGEESGFDADGFCELASPPTSCSVLGAIHCTTGGDIVSQLDLSGEDCFPQTVQNCAGFCTDGNTDFCALMRCWSGGGSSCLLTGIDEENPQFWVDFFDRYMSLIPTAGEGQSDLGAPSGNCTPAPGALPPGLAGCPLEPGSFSFNGGWHSYCVIGNTTYSCSSSPCPGTPGYIHDAVDLGASRGTPVYAVANGVAFGLGSDGHGLGFHVILQATNPETGEPAGIFVYAHLTETSHTDVDPDIPATGRWVSMGDPIGFVDDTGHSDGDHLHFAYYPNGVIHSSNAWPIECLGIDCISDTSASNQCTDDQVICQ